MGSRMARPVVVDLSFLMKSTEFFVAITCIVCMRSIGGRIPTLTTAETRAGPHGHHGLGRHGHGALT